MNRKLRGLAVAAALAITMITGSVGSLAVDFVCPNGRAACVSAGVCVKGCAGHTHNATCLNDGTCATGHLHNENCPENCGTHAHNGACLQNGTCGGHLHDGSCGAQGACGGYYRNSTSGTGGGARRSGGGHGRMHGGGHC